jgi:hypothetical protein
MATTDSIVITKETNGNITVTPEGTEYTISPRSILSKDLSSVTVRQPFSNSAVVVFTVDAVEKVVSTDGGEVIISDVDTLFNQLNDFFFLN